MERQTGKDIEHSKHEPSDILGSQSSDVADPSLLGCDTVLFRMKLPTFKMNVASSSSGSSSLLRLPDVTNHSPNDTVPLPEDFSLKHCLF